MDAVLRERVKGLISQKKFEKETPKKSKVVKGASVLLGVLIGFVNGLFGAGGGMLVVPVLTFLLGLNTKRAHATAILIILPLCAVSGVVYLTRGMGGEGMFLPTVGGVVLGGIVGAFALKKCSGVALQFVFYGIMLLAGLKMIF